MKPLIVPLEEAPPAEALAAAFARRPYPFFLDSSLRHHRLGRYSFVGCDPFLVMRASGRSVTIEDRAGTTRHTVADPFDMLQDLMARCPVEDGPWPVPFVGGAVGYLGYDLGRLIERLPSRAARHQPEIPDAAFAFYDALLAYDHVAGQAYLLSTGYSHVGEAPSREWAAQRLGWLRQVAADAGKREANSEASAPTGAPSGLSSNFSRGEYLKAVQRARQYIIAGDCYQVNLSQRFQAPWPDSPWDLYAALRAVNPAPFAAFQDFGAFAVVSSSPERFLCQRGVELETRPIKGTRPRGSTPAEDAALAAELLASEKDHAEHIMIVDLERNDLGRVCEVGTVRVAELAALEPYATVFHLTSSIQGRRRAGRSLADVLRACFPGGSITGAPKIRAMEIIEELEPTRRGLYTGAIGYVSAHGDFDFNIAIRTLVVKDGVASFQVGGGIVYDSQPEAEYQETLDKGRALMQALRSRAPSAVSRR